MRRMKRFIAGVAVSLSVVLSAVTAFAVGSITGIIENPEANFDNATLSDGTPVDSDGGYRLRIKDSFDGAFFETEAGKKLLDEVINPLNGGTVTLSEAIKNPVKAANTSEVFDISDYEMLTHVFDADIVDEKDVVIEGVKGVEVSFDLTNLNKQEIVVLHYNLVLGAWEVYENPSVNGTRVTLTLGDMSPSPLCVLYKTDNNSAPAGDFNPVIPVVGIICLAAGGAVVIFRKKIA